jgi:hypothetical protein
MESITRRSFLRQGAAGAAVLGVAGIAARVPSLARQRSRREAVSRAEIRPAGAQPDETLVVHIPDAGAGELRIMFGTSEVVRQDPSLVAQLVRASRPFHS